MRTAKTFISIGLLALLLSTVGVPDLAAVLANAKVYYLAVPLLLEATDALIRACNLRTLLTARNVCLSFRKIAYSYVVVGGFFGTIIPSSLGTDAVRALNMARRHGVKIQDSVTCLVLLNLIGLFARCLIAAPGSLIMLIAGRNTFLFAATFAAALTYMCIFIAAALLGLPKWLWAKTVLVGFVHEKISRIYSVLRSFSGQRRLLGYVFCIALLDQIMGILAVYSVALALNLDIPISYFFLFIPVVAISRLLPASVLGFGAEQGIMVLLFHQIGVPTADALAVSLVFSTICLTVGMFWGLLYLSASVGLIGTCGRWLPGKRSAEQALQLKREFGNSVTGLNRRQAGHK